MIYFYSGCVIVSILMYLLLYITDVKRSLCQHVMVIIMTFSNLGYLSLALSGGISGAIVSAKIVNLGGSFLPVLYFFTMCEVYDKAFSIIEEDAGVHFDYDLAMVFISCRSELEAYYNKNS